MLENILSVLWGLAGLSWPAVWRAFVVLFVLLIFFLAVMKLRDVKEEGKLVGPFKWVGLLILLMGYALDLIANVFPFSFLLWEPPRWFGLREGTVSARTKRWAATDTWRGAISRYTRKTFLAPADKSGGHD